MLATIFVDKNLISNHCQQIGGKYTTKSADVM